MTEQAKKRAPSIERWFLTSDGDGHWFVVPVERMDEWLEWRALDDDDERSWDAPEFALAVGGSPTLVSFTDPRIG